MRHALFGLGVVNLLWIAAAASADAGGQAPAAGGGEPAATMIAPAARDQNEVALGLGLAGLSASHARKVGSGTALGAGFGLGGDWVNFCAGTSDHLGTDGVLEMADDILFLRQRTVGPILVEAGGRASLSTCT